MRDLNRGKNTIDDTGHGKNSVTRPKPLDFVRLSSKSTPEHPLMLGGTLEEAKAYFNGLSHADRLAYSDYEACLQRLQGAKDPNSTDIAKNEYPRGYEIYQKYHGIKSEKAEQSKNQPGESSTTYSSIDKNWDWTNAIDHM